MVSDDTVVSADVVVVDQERAEFKDSLTKRASQIAGLVSEKQADGTDKLYIKVKSGKRISVPTEKISQDELNLLMLLDEKNSGTITLQDIVRVQAQKEKGEQDARIMKRFIIGLLVLLSVLFIGMFAITFSVVEMAKEMRSDDKGVMKTSGDSIARVGSHDREVSETGELVQPSDSSSRRLQDGSSLTGIGVQVAVHERVLSSSLPNSYFSALQEISVYSNLVTLEVAILGYSRVTVLNAKCGNIVNLHTAWGGTITLDGDDLSFDKETAKLFEGAGIMVGVGGTQGRRLQGSQAKGFFHHIGEIGDEWECRDVPLPSLPDRFKYTETRYVPCSIEGSPDAEVKISPCDSAYGGKIPGAQILPPKLALATLSKAEQYLLTAGVLEEDVRAHYFVKEETIWMRSLNWEIQRDRMPNHPGQEKIFIFDKTKGLTAVFQRWINATDPDLRAYCAQVDAADSAMAHASDMLEDPAMNTTMHFEYLDLIEENGRFYRHFRMMPSDQLLAQQNGVIAEDERPASAFYEFWDDSETLQPYRMLTPGGLMMMFDSVQQNFTDADVLAELAAMGLDATNAAVCPENEVNMTTDGTPEMLSVLLENELAVTQFYQDYFTEVNATSQTELNYLTYADAVIANPLPLPDPCKAQCKTNVDRLKSGMSYDSDTCADLVDAANCVRSLPENRCRQAPFLQYLAEEIDACLGMTSVPENSTQRRLADLSPLFLPQGPLKLDGVKAKPAKQDEVEPDVSLVEATLVDGSRALNLRAVPEEKLQQLGELFDADLSRGGVLVWNDSAQDETSQVPTEVALVTAGDAPGATVVRRLSFALTIGCQGWAQNTFQQHLIAPSKWGAIDYCIHFGCTCDPGKINSGEGIKCPWCHYTSMAGSLQFKFGKHPGTSYGAITIQAGGTIDLGTYFGIPAWFPLQVSCGATGAVTYNSNPPQACKDVGVSHTFSGYLAVDLTFSVNIAGIISATLASRTLTVSAGQTTRDHNCKTMWDEGRRRRRFWSRRRNWWHCDKVCDTYIRGELAQELWLGPFVAVRQWGRLQYWFSGKIVQFQLGVDTYGFWCGWHNFVQRTILEIRV